MLSLVIVLFVAIVAVYICSNITMTITCQRNQMVKLPEPEFKSEEELIKETAREFFLEKSKRVLESSSRLQQSMKIAIWLQVVDYP